MKMQSVLRYCLLTLISIHICHAEDDTNQGIDRTIADVTGRKIDVTILEISDVSIRVQRKIDGKEFEIPLERLCQNDRAWVKARQDAETNSPTPAPAKPELAPLVKVRPTPQPPPRSKPKLLSSKEIIDAQLKAGMVLPPRGWDALETTIRFKDGRQIDGFVYDIQGERFWYAARDMVQISASLDELEVRYRLRIVQWRSRAPYAGSPSVALVIDGQVIHASIIAKKDESVDLLTEAGEMMVGVPLAKFDAESRKFTEDWLAGNWEPKESEWVIAPKYSRAMQPFWNGQSLVRHKGKWGVIRGAGEYVIAPTYDDVVSIPNSVNLKLRKGDKWGLMDNSGRTILEPEWEDVGDLHHGIVPVLSGGKWGYAQEGGKIVVPCEWDDAWRFSLSGTAIVTRNGKRGFVDRTGKVIVKPEWDGALMHTPEGIGAVRRGKGWALVDQSGKLLCEPVWDFSWHKRRFELGFIEASRVDRDSELVTRLGIDGKPYAADRLRDGVCLACQPEPTDSSDFTLLDKDVQEYAFDEISYAGGGFAAFRKGNLWGYADARGMVIEPRWNRFGIFSEGLAAVTEPDGTPRDSYAYGNSWQFIDTVGKTIIPANKDIYYEAICYEGIWRGEPAMQLGRVAALKKHEYRWKRVFVDDRGRIHSGKKMEIPPPGLSFVKAEKDQRIGLIDTAGKEIFPPEYEDFRTYSKHWIGIKKNGLWGLADRTGRIVVPPFSEDQAHRTLILPENGMALIGIGNQKRIFWPDKTELQLQEQNLVYVDDYGPHLIMKKGEEDHTEWWIARSDAKVLRKLEGARRIYWNMSMVEFERIWIEDQETKRWHFCSIDGKRLGPQMAEKPEQWFFDGGQGIMREGDSCYFIDKDGQKAGADNWQDARIFRNGMAAVKRGDRWGFIDSSGKLLIDNSYDEVGDFFVASHESGDTTPLLAAACLKGRWGYINPKGEAVIALEHDARGSWQFGRIWFSNPGRHLEIRAAYEADGKRVQAKSQSLAQDFWQEISEPSTHRHAGNWKIIEGKDGMKSLVNDAGVVALQPEWHAIVWVAPGVVAVRSKYSGGLFSPEKGWIFREDDELRIQREGHHGKLNDRFNQYGFIVTERPPKWGYARYCK